MLTEEAIVRMTDGSTVYLEPRRTSHCGGCSLNKSCGHRLFDSLFGNREQSLVATLAGDVSPQSVKPGDTVLLAMEEGALLKGTGLLYGLPLLGLVVGASVLAQFWQNEGLILGGALGGLFTGLVVASNMTRDMEKAALFVRPMSPDGLGDNIIASDSDSQD